MDAATEPLERGTGVDELLTPERKTARLLAVFSALSFSLSASRYSARPILIEIAHSLHTTPKQVSWMVAITEIGTVMGLISLVPLADAFNQRRLSTLLLLLSALSVFGIALAPNLAVLLIASFCAGAALCVHHILVAWAVAISPDNESGSVVGWMHSGTVLGTFAGNVFAGAVAAMLSWRFVYVGFALLLIAPIPLLRRLHLQQKPVQSKSWPTLIKDLALLLRDPQLRRASIVGGLLFCSYHVVWLSLGIMLRTPPFHYGSLRTGLFGSISIVGAVVSPLAGRWMDRVHGTVTLICSLAIFAVAAVLLMFIGPQSTPLLITGLVLFDIGVRASQVSAQSIVYRTRRVNYGRATTVYMIFYLLGGSLGSYLSTTVWQVYGWQAVCMTSLFVLSLAIAVLAYPAMAALASGKTAKPDSVVL